MRIPRTPPSLTDFLSVIGASRFLEILSTTTDHLVNGRYLHWEKARFHQPPQGLTPTEWWHGIKFKRQQQYKPLPLNDKNHEPFQYLYADPIPELIHKIDLGAGGQIGVPEQVTNPDTRDQYYVSSLIEEAITSSQLEGATTTRLIAKEMIRSGRPPRDKSEVMILNNYKAMKRIGELKHKPLTQELVFEIHQIVTAGTLDDPSAAGRFRLPAEVVRVEGNYGEIYHDPPRAVHLADRMVDMCEFANSKSPEGFLHPLLRAITLHFWLSYDHPFVDGNGRTARALFYWSMLHHGYWLFEFVSISHIIRKAPVKYGKAFLHTETDDNDLTYFILYHLDVITKAIQELHDYIARKVKLVRQTEANLRGIEVLNHRQRSIISHAIRHPNTKFTIASHQTSHNVVYETARRDLLDLTEKELFQAAKAGKTWYFMAHHGLEDRLAKLSIFKP